MREQAIALNFQPRPALGKRSSRTFVPRENRRHGMAWRGGIEYFIMANDRFINSNLSAIKSQPPSPHEGPIGRTDGRTNNAPIIGRRRWRRREEKEYATVGDGRRPKPNLRAKRINDGRIEDRENERTADSDVIGGREGERAR